MSLSWTEILALEPPALTLAIERQVYHHPWKGFEAVVDDPRLSVHLPRHTATWDACMPLAWRYKIGLRRDLWDGMGTIAWHVEWPGDTHGCVGMETETEARMAICRLALWAAQEEGK